MQLLPGTLVLHIAMGPAVQFAINRGKKLV
jgi:hypothetical protein